MPDQDIKDFDPVSPINNVTVWGTSSAQNATQVGQVDDLIRQVLSTVARADFGTYPVLADMIDESTPAAGVTVDGLLIKDGAIDFGVTGVVTDLVSESTTDAGVTVDGVLLKDNDVTATDVSATTVTTTGNAEVGGQGYSPPQVLTAGASVAWNLDSGNTARLQLSASGTLANPTNIQDGGTYILRVKQSGSFTLAFGTAYEFADSEVPVVTTGAGAVDVYCFYADEGVMHLVPAQNFG